MLFIVGRLIEESLAYIYRRELGVVKQIVEGLFYFNM